MHYCIYLRCSWKWIYFLFIIFENFCTLECKWMCKASVYQFSFILFPTFIDGNLCFRKLLQQGLLFVVFHPSRFCQRIRHRKIFAFLWESSCYRFKATINGEIIHRIAFSVRVLSGDQYGLFCQEIALKSLVHNLLSWVLQITHRVLTICLGADWLIFTYCQGVPDLEGNPF